MGVDSVTADGLLKRVYTDGKIQNLQNMEAETFTKLNKSPRKFGGEGFFGPAHVQGNQRGQGSQNENEALRTAGAQIVKQWKIVTKILTHTIKFSGLSLEIANGNEESFADNLVFNSDNGIKDATKELNAQLYRTGSGVVALVNGSQAATPQILFDNGVPTHFRVGEFIDVVDINGIKEVAGKQIIDVDVGAQTITMGDASGNPINVTVTDNSRIVRENILDLAPPDGKELGGYPLVADDGTIASVYENIPRIGVGQAPNWRGFTIDATGANISNDLLHRSVFRLKVLSGTKVKTIRSNTSQIRKYLDLTIPSIRWKKGDIMDSNNANKTDDGEEPTWAGKSWSIDTDIGFDEIYMEDNDYVQLYEVRPLRFDDTDGGKILKWHDGFDAFIAFLKYYGNAGSENPRKGLRIKNLNVPTF